MARSNYLVIKDTISGLWYQWRHYKRVGDWKKQKEMLKEINKYKKKLKQEW